MNKKIIFISWTDFGRHTELLGEALGTDIFFIKGLIKSRRLTWRLLFPLDYLIKGLKTVKILLRIRPSVVFVQNPPSLAPILIVMCSKYFKTKTVIDSHNGAFEKLWMNVPFHIWALRNASIVTLHNQEIFKRLVSNKKLSDINFMILGSRLPEYPTISKDNKEKKYFLVISTFSSDEPMENLLEGITIFLSNNNNNFKFKVTGNYKKKRYLYEKYSKYKNIEFLGFVDDNKYNHLVVNAYGIISLSTRDDVQQMALIEAIGAEVPFISSKNLTNVSLFGDQMILIDNIPNKIVEGINSFIQNKKVLDKNVFDIKVAQKSKWEKDFNILIQEFVNSNDR